MTTANVTPGDLGRAALHDDPVAAAQALVAWCDGDEVELFSIIEWMRAVADTLEAGAADA